MSVIQKYSVGCLLALFTQSAAHASLNFSAITTIQDQSYKVSQTMNIAKVGLNYKFG